MHTALSGLPEQLLNYCLEHVSILLEYVRARMQETPIANSSLPKIHTISRKEKQNAPGTSVGSCFFLHVHVKWEKLMCRILIDTFN